jgi:hypothetical protein
METVMAIMTSSTRRTGDHFEPNDGDPQVQRRLRGYLEQIDYTAFASNKAVLGATVPHADAGRFKWVAEAATRADAGASLSEAQVARLAHLRTAYEELAAAYEATRRLVERGYVAYRATEV